MKYQSIEQRYIAIGKPFIVFKSKIPRIRDGSFKDTLQAFDDFKNKQKNV